MALTKYKLGQLIELSEARNSEGKYGIDAVKGISIKKIFIETKADMEGVGLKPYLVVSPNDFAYVTITSRNGEKITLAHNTTEETFIVSSSYVVFRVCRTELLNSDWLFMYFNRPEFDRYARFNSWGSARETFSWDDMRDIDIDLPPLSVQENYVAVYNSMVANLKAYEKGLADLKLACDATIEDLRKTTGRQPLSGYISRVDERNTSNRIRNVKGVSIAKEFREPTSKVNRDELANYKVVKPRQFSFVQTTNNEKCFAYALNTTSEDIVVTPVNEVFSVDEEGLVPEFLSLFFNRKEFDRYARFHSWGSARETFTWENLCSVEIPVPDLDQQKSLGSLCSVLGERKRKVVELQLLISKICPILVKGSLEEGKHT